VREPQETPQAVERGGFRRPPARKSKKRRPGGLDGTLLTAEYRNHVWGLDFEFDETADLRMLKLLNIVDEHTREALAMDVDGSITADKVVACLERLIAQYGAPEFIRVHNGPEMIARVLRDWCRLRGLGIVYIEPGSPCRTRGSSRSTAESAMSC
jgi:putative transposase